MKFLLFCCLFGAFLATGMCIECELCVELGQTCNGTKQTCEDNEDTCVMLQTELIRAPVSLTLTAKLCGHSETCHLDYLETNLPHELAMRSKRVCCTGNECKTLPPVALEPQDNSYNGLHCPGCIGLTSTECNEKLVSCRGIENRCLSFIGKSIGFLTSKASVKGCASESLCSLLEKRFWSRAVEWEFDIKCTPASPSLRSDV